MSFDAGISTSNDRIRRLGRLTLKELREILRDRRTIVTLVLMPLLMYPLLGVAFKQFFVSQLQNLESTRYRICFESENDAVYLLGLFEQAGMPVAMLGDEKRIAEYRGKEPLVEVVPQLDIEQAVRQYDVNVGLRIDKATPPHFDPGRDLHVRVAVVYRDDWSNSREAAIYVERFLETINRKFLDARFERLNLTQRSQAIQIDRTPLPRSDHNPSSVSILAVIPFILILMTVTGAVYPAIDLTAGERERGTLEVLVAAPIPRIGVLLAKYIAVVAVAMLTASANLLTLTVTVFVGGLGSQLFAEGELTFGTVAAIFAILTLFAAFFSALLLAVTCTARSFKEAQAYLIPLMLVSLSPGMLSLTPDVELSGLWLVTPLANIVLLGRDLLKLQADLTSTLIVSISTMLNAGAAIAIAARVFGSESVLYSSQSGWAELFRRPRRASFAPTVTAATFCLAVMLPAYIFLFDLLSQSGGDIVAQQGFGVGMTVLVFGAIPWVACHFRRVIVRPMFRLPRYAPWCLLAAVVLGMSFWAINYELVQWVHALRQTSFDEGSLASFAVLAAKIRSLPMVFTLLTMVVVPAVFEEWFFRGYLFSALNEKMTPTAAIAISGIVFGLFHAINPHPLAFERVVSTMMTGLLLGWVRWRTASVVPGMVLHAVNNSLALAPVYFQAELAKWGVDELHRSHLPTSWIVGAGLAVAMGSVLLYVATRSDRLPGPSRNDGPSG